MDWGGQPRTLPQASAAFPKHKIINMAACPIMETAQCLNDYNVDIKLQITMCSLQGDELCVYNNWSHVKYI